MIEILVVIVQYLEKVYGQVLVGVLLMLVLYFDVCYFDGKCVVLFGLFVIFLIKFLKNGLFFDLFSIIIINNVLLMIYVGFDNFDLVKYLVSQVMFSDDDCFVVLKEYYLDVCKEDWKLIQVGQCVQIIKKDVEKGGVLKFGIEVVVDQQKIIFVLFGVLLGVFIVVLIILNVFKQMFLQQFNLLEWQSCIYVIVLSYGQKLNGNVVLIQQVWDDIVVILQLMKLLVIQMLVVVFIVIVKLVEMLCEVLLQYDMVL